MNRFKFQLYTGGLVILLLLLLPYVWNLFCILFFSSKVPIFAQLELYKWGAIGVVVAVVLKRIATNNIIWFETFCHEFTHIVIALLFFRKVHSFHAEEENGVVYTSGPSPIGVIPMALAPYCFPIFTYLFLALRPLVAFQGLWIIDIFIGISIAFHIECFSHQTEKYQTDINQFPLYFSYLYIYIARLINGCIIVVAFFPHYNVFTSIWRLLCALYDNFIFFMEWIF